MFFSSLAVGYQLNGFAVGYIFFIHITDFPYEYYSLCFIAVGFLYGLWQMIDTSFQPHRLSSTLLASLQLWLPLFSAHCTQKGSSRNCKMKTSYYCSKLLVSTLGNTIFIFHELAQVCMVHDWMRFIYLNDFIHKIK
jgi:hypothetical protein